MTRMYDEVIEGFAQRMSADERIDESLSAALVEMLTKPDLPSGADVATLIASRCADLVE